MPNKQNAVLYQWIDEESNNKVAGFVRKIIAPLSVMDSLENLKRNEVISQKMDLSTHLTRLRKCIQRLAGYKQTAVVCLMISIIY
jgi:Ribonuclease G/E